MNLRKNSFVFKIYKELSNSAEKSSQIRNWAEVMNRYFSEEDVQIVNKDRERCSSLAIREI